MAYTAPTGETSFILNELVGYPALQRTERFADTTADVTEAILGEAGRLAERLWPLGAAGDRDPARLENGRVRTTEGFAEAYRAISDGGWIGLAAPPQRGGMGLPQCLNVAVNEYLASACLALEVKLLLTQGQIDALEHHGSEAQKALYLPKLTTGEWSGTMNLTEPQAGSDVGALATRAEPQADGSWSVTGQKIYISWGDSDLVENVCHLVLARTPDAPGGTRGISLFMVPKVLPGDDGGLGPPNTLRVLGLEEKLGLHGSPTAVMSYEGARGWLVGAEHGGMAAMFTMMNNARLGVAAQGIGLAEAAYQHALAYARDRRQGAVGGTGAIVEHPDVRRMLAEAKAEIFAARAIALACGVAIDEADATGSDDWRARAAFLTPIAKSYCTEVGCRTADSGIQVHGGMGYVEDTGAARFLRDARITPIYEGTNGIQAIDLVGRKLADGGEAAFRLIDEIETGAETARRPVPDMARSVWSGAESLREATEWMLAQGIETRLGGASAFLNAFALVLGGHFHLKAATRGGAARRALAEVYVARILPRAGASLAAAQAGVDDLFALSVDDLG
ncbi:MAG: acyl-CoA dehydrogenase [Paracoccaceae bacterium]|nr:acyl-CoA dehydrogenase [Paracoccaceae bacterium]